MGGVTTSWKDALLKAPAASAAWLAGAPLADSSAVQPAGASTARSYTSASVPRLLMVAVSTAELAGPAAQL